MKKTKRLTGMLIVSLILLVALAACGGNANNNANNGSSQAGEAGAEKATVTMGFWGTAQDLQIYQAAADAISEQYPNIELKIKQYPSSDQFWNTLPGEIAAGVAPDFIKISNEGSFEYINKGLFAPLDEHIGPSGVDMSRFSESAMDIWKVDGKQYGVPNTAMPAMFFINEDLWKEAGLGEYPKTWDEVEAAAKELTNKDRYGIAINIDAYHITNIAKSYGGDWGNGATINSPENVQALQKIFDMYEEGIAVTPKSLGYGWDGEVFANGKAVMTTGGYWYKGYLKDAAPDLKYVAFPVPEGTTAGSTMIADGYVVLKDAKNKEAALQAAYFMTNDTVLTEFLKLGANPAVPGLSSQYFEENPEFANVQPALEYSTDFAYPAETKRFRDELVNQIESVVLGGVKKSPQEILDGIQEQFK